MFLGKVVGSVWATKKTDNLKNLRFLIVNPLNLKKAPLTDVVVVADLLGAGVGEVVICAYGHAARQAISPDDPSSVSIEAAVVAIVDRVDVDAALIDPKLKSLDDSKGK
ncbi:MAG: EutN/CcmL family microcompartment protein [Calditrichaceae bacterium]